MFGKEITHLHFLRAFTVRYSVTSFDRALPILPNARNKSII